jgi:hypothetical protein
MPLGFIYTMPAKHIYRFFLLFFIVNSTPFVSQSQIIYIKVTGVNNNMLPNATVALSDTEIYLTDSNGVAAVPKKSKGDVWVSCIGYKNLKKTIFEWQNIKDTVIVSLEKNIINEETVKVTAVFDKTEKHGVTKRKLDKAVIGTLTGTIHAIKVRGYKYPSRIKSFSYFIPRQSSQNAKLRLRIFHADSLQRPDYDLLDSSIIIENYKPGNWNKVSLEALKLKTPENNCFYIGIELLPSGIKENSFTLEMIKSKAGNFSFEKSHLGYWNLHTNSHLTDKNYTFYVTLKTL